MSHETDERRTARLKLQDSYLTNDDRMIVARGGTVIVPRALTLSMIKTGSLVRHWRDKCGWWTPSIDNSARLGLHPMTIPTSASSNLEPEVWRPSLYTTAFNAMHTIYQRAASNLERTAAARGPLSWAEFINLARYAEAVQGFNTTSVDCHDGGHDFHWHVKTTPSTSTSIAKTSPGAPFDPRRAADVPSLICPDGSSRLIGINTTGSKTRYFVNAEYCSLGGDDAPPADLRRLLVSLASGDANGTGLSTVLQKVFEGERSMGRGRTAPVTWRIEEISDAEVRAIESRCSGIVELYADLVWDKTGFPNVRMASLSPLSACREVG